MNRRARAALALTVFCTVLIASGSARASPLLLPQENAVPGGVKIIRLDVTGAVHALCRGRWASRVGDSGRRGLGGGDRHPPVGAAGNTAGDRARNQRQTGHRFSVGDKHYASQSLKVAPRQVDLSAADLARFNRGKSAHRPCLEPLDRRTARVPAPASAGARPAQQLIRIARIFNGQSRNPHTRHGHCGAERHPRAAAHRRDRDRHGRTFSSTAIPCSSITAAASSACTAI